MSDGHCTEGARCVCGGDLPSVRAGCHYWRASAPKQAQETSLPPQGAADVRLADDDALRFACRVLEGNYPTEQDKRDARSGLMAIRTRLREPTAASPAPAPQEPARPDILEKLTYHQHERDDLTLDECLEVLASGYRKVHGRTDRQMVMQILALLAASPAPGALGAAWQPIETAPRDRTNVLLYVPPKPGLRRAVVLEGAWFGDFWCAFNADRAVQRVEPTHWMPLPQPPQQAPSESSAQGSGGAQG